MKPKKPMTPEDAYQTVKDAAMQWVRVMEDGSAVVYPNTRTTEEAISTLDGLTAHWSRFSVGDEVWTYVQGYSGKWLVQSAKLEVIHSNGILTLDVGHTKKPWERFEKDCYATEAEARAECKLRNAK